MDLELVNNKINEIGLNKERTEFEKIIGQTLDKTANYIIKSLPVNDSVKDVIKDVKESIKSKDMSVILKTVVNSSLREGMEFLGIDKNKINNLTEMKNIVFKGGFRENLSASLETVYSKYIKSNLLSEEIKSFLNKFIDRINTKDFSNAIDKNFSVISNKQDELNALFNKWYKAYNSSDFKEMDKLNTDISKLIAKTNITSEQNKNFKIITNISEYMKNKQCALTEIEEKFCQNV